MLKVPSSILCDLDPKVKAIGQKAGICDGVPSTSALVSFTLDMFKKIRIRKYRIMFFLTLPLYTALSIFIPFVLAYTCLTVNKISFPLRIKDGGRNKVKLTTRVLLVI